jgi:hypothetical protein
MNKQTPEEPLSGEQKMGADDLSAPNAAGEIAAVHPDPQSLSFSGTVPGSSRDPIAIAPVVITDLNVNASTVPGSSRDNTFKAGINRMNPGAAIVPGSSPDNTVS